MIDRQHIEKKRQEVRLMYGAYGWGSPEYNKAFGELHELNMLYLAQLYRKTYGLPPTDKTPYCP